MKQPPRLLDDPSVAPELRSDLSRTASAEPAYDVSAGLVALQAAIVASAAAPAASTAAAHSGSAAAHAGAAAASKGALSAVSAKLAIAAIGTAAVIAVTTAAWPRGTSTPRAAAPARPVATSAPQPAPRAATPAQEGVTPGETGPTPEPATPSARPLPPHARAAQAPASRDDDAELRREIAQLGRIKSLVERDPNEAYRLALQGDREFVRGMLLQERSALAVVALVNAGRTSEATRRAQAFLARYPNSPSRERIERLLRGEQE